MHLTSQIPLKKVPQIAVCEQSESEKFEILFIFGQKDKSNFRRNALIHKFRTRSTFEKFAPSAEEKNPWYMGLVEASQMHRLMKQGGLGGCFFFFFFFLSGG